MTLNNYKGHKFVMISSSSSGDWVCENCGQYVSGGPHDGRGYYPGRGQNYPECLGSSEARLERELRELRGLTEDQ